MAVAEKHVAAAEYQPAIFNSRQVDIAELPEFVPIRQDLAVDSQPGHAAVWINLEAQVRESIFTLDGKRILRISCEW